MRSVYSVALAVLLLGGWVSEAVSDTTLSGKTVEFRSGTIIEGVTVTVKDARNQRKLGEVKSDPSGRYEVEISGDHEFFDINYDPPKNSAWDPAGRSSLTRVGPIFDLDTAGLTNKRSGGRDEAEQRQHARNTRGYVAAGGNASAAIATVKAAHSRFGPGYEGFARSMGVMAAFQRAKLPFPNR